MNPVKRKSWGPYAVGAEIGLLEAFALATAKKPLGVSSVFEQVAAKVIQAVSPRTADTFIKANGAEPEIGWETALVGGILAGSAASAMLSGDHRTRRVPRMWRRAVSPSRAGRYSAALAGGRPLRRHRVSA